MQDPTKVVVLIGAPGVFNYQGQIIYYADSRKEYVETRNNSALGYQGYSVASGQFFKKDKNDIAAGAPRFKHYGMVVLFRHLGNGGFDPTSKAILPPLIKGGKEQRQPGTGFGYAICAVDLDGDGYSELLVGAPFFSDDLHPEQGRVYLYDNKGDGDLRLSAELPEVFSSDRWRANFGRAIAAVGDIDLDGYQDVAIGAPYESNGEGVVYIYRGSKGGLIKKPMQIIKGSTVSPGIKTFGYSFSGKLDMDDNGYPDILIGAYQADRVVLLRSKPVVSFSSRINIDPSTFDIKGRKTCNETGQGNVEFATQCFAITVCTKYTERAGKVKDQMGVVLILKSDIDYAKPTKRVLFSLNKQDEINGTKDIQTSENCFNWRAYLREGVRDVFPDIKFKLTYKIVEKTPPTPSSPTDVPSLVPYAVLDPSKPQEETAVLTFKRDCQKCVPDLQLDVSNNELTLAVGEETYRLEVTVKNSGDDAYNAKVDVTIPKGINFLKILKVQWDKESSLAKPSIEKTKLSTNDTLLSIEIGNPVPKESQRSLVIELDTSTYSDEPDFLPINMSTYSINREDQATLADNYGFLNISIESKADLEVNGITVEEQVSYGGKVVGESAMKRVEDIGNEVIHKYFVKNRGPNQIPSSEIVIQWPFEAPSGKHLLYLIDVKFEGKNGKCDFKPGQPNLLGLETSSTSAISGQPQNDTVDAAEQTRRRREVKEDEEKSNSKVKREAEPAKDKPSTELDCESGTAKCTDIHCTIRSLKKDEDVTITVLSRLWNGTMIEDYQGQLLKVISRATVRPLNTFVQEKNKVNNKAEVSTQLNPDTNVAAPSRKLPKWVIPVCIVGAVLLLILIVFCLYKLGFFKRQKYDKNITDPEEMDSMLDNGKV